MLLLTLELSKGKSYLINSLQTKLTGRISFWIVKNRSRSVTIIVMQYVLDPLILALPPSLMIKSKACSQEFLLSTLNSECFQHSTCFFYQLSCILLEIHIFNEFVKNKTTQTTLIRPEMNLV